MPILQTRANASATGYGLFRTMSAGNDGTIGIFGIGSCCTSTIRNKYTYASDSSTASGVAAASVSYTYGSGAAGTTAFGIHALGYNSGTANYSTIRNKYTYANDTSAVATSSCPTNSGRGAAAGNSTRGIFQLGANTTSTCAGTTNRQKYTYSNDTSVTAAAASQATRVGAGAGNSTRGIFQLNGGALGQSSNARNKYTYACDTSTSAGVGAASKNASGGSAAAGNSTVGVFFIGSWCCGASGSNIRNLYTYASCTQVVTTNTYYAQTKDGNFGTGNSTRGIFNRGRNCATTNTTCRCKFTYACQVTAAAAASSRTAMYGNASSWATCVNT